MQLSCRKTKWYTWLSYYITDPDSVDSIFEPVCDADGKFRPKQCHGEVCVCINPETGDTIANSVADAQNLQCVQGVCKVIFLKSSVLNCTVYSFSRVRRISKNMASGNT